MKYPDYILKLRSALQLSHIFPFVFSYRLDYRYSLHMQCCGWIILENFLSMNLMPLFDQSTNPALTATQARATYSIKLVYARGLRKKAPTSESPFLGIINLYSIPVSTTTESVTLTMVPALP